jgi:hypothetical protein
MLENNQFFPWVVSPGTVQIDAKTYSLEGTMGTGVILRVVDESQTL